MLLLPGVSSSTDRSPLELECKTKPSNHFLNLTSDQRRVLKDTGRLVWDSCVALHISVGVFIICITYVFRPFIEHTF